MELNMFCWNFAYVPSLPMSTKEYLGFFLLSLHLESFAKIKKDLVLLTHGNQAFHIFINSSRSKQNKKNPEHPFVDIVK